MVNILNNYSLKALNTFGIDANAKFYAEFNSSQELKDILVSQKVNEQPLLIIGGGSNLLLTKDFDGIVLKNKIVGIEKIGEDAESVLVKSGAGVVWHDLVMHCIAHGYGGVENLSLIPGSVGASPMQNIGAYGVELKEVFHSLEALEIKTGTLKTFSKEECKFGYRESVFKTIYKNQYVITSVTLRLRTTPAFNTSYGAIEEELKKTGVNSLSIKAISDAVCAIRRSKLPDPKVTGNAGSFFKNPEVSESFYEKLKADYPAIVAYPTSPGKMKLAAGWMIEQCGWKGKEQGRAAVHSKQALVLVNKGGATGREIFDLACAVQNSVKEKFGVELEMEVNII